MFTRIIAAPRPALPLPSNFLNDGSLHNVTSGLDFGVGDCKADMTFTTEGVHLAVCIANGGTSATSDAQCEHADTAMEVVQPAAATRTWRMRLGGTAAHVQLLCARGASAFGAIRTVDACACALAAVAQDADDLERSFPRVLVHVGEGRRPGGWGAAGERASARQVKARERTGEQTGRGSDWGGVRRQTDKWGVYDGACAK